MRPAKQRLPAAKGSGGLGAPSSSSHANSRKRLNSSAKLCAGAKRSQSTRELSNPPTFPPTSAFSFWIIYERPETEVLLAERAGFEPAIPLRVCRISSAVLSTTQPPLRISKYTLFLNVVVSPHRR
jgi:hypothetical protein